MLPPKICYLRPVGAVGAAGFVGLCIFPLFAAFSCRDMAANLACDAAFWVARCSTLSVGAAGLDGATGLLGAAVDWAWAEKAPANAVMRTAASVDFFMESSNG